MSDRFRRFAIVLALPWAAFAATAASAYDWLQFNGDAAHSGNNVAETIIGAGNVASLTQKFQITLPNTADGAPVFLQGVTTPGGVRDLLFVTTTDGFIVALDAQTGATVWSHQNGPNGCIDSNGSICFTTSSPAIDPNRQYIYSYGLDGRAHKYQVGDGTEILTGGWPQLTTLKPTTEKSASALATATSGGATYLYVVHGGYPGDAGDYQGHVTVINLATGAQKVFNTVCSDKVTHLGFSDPNCNASQLPQNVQNAVWARPGVIYDGGTSRIFFATGNGHYSGNTGGKNWSESVLTINPDGTGASGNPLDSYTPTNAASLDGGDTDLGSTAPAILPVPANSNVQHLAVQGGKDRLLRLINLGNLSGQGGPGHTGGEVQGPFSVPQGGLVFSQPAVWVSPGDSSTWVFVGTSGGISGLQLSVDVAGNPSLSSPWNDTLHGAATSPLLANGVLYSFGGGVVRARDPTTGSLLWTSPSLGGTHWQSPVVANGVIYVADNSGHLAAFAAPSAPPTFTSSNTTTFQVGVAGTFTVRATGAPAPTLSEAGSLPNGVIFTASTGFLAGTPTVAGTFPLQFTASNGVPPDAIQPFTLIVSAGPAVPGQVTYNGANCTSFVMSGSPPNQTLTCASGGGAPVCAPNASPPSPAKGQATTISANCSNQPFANGYVWTGGACAGLTAPTCTMSKSRASTITFSVTATNAAGTGAPAQISVTWH